MSFDIFLNSHFEETSEYKSFKPTELLLLDTQIYLTAKN